MKNFSAIKFFRVLKNSLSRLVKKVQLRGARKIDERRRTCAVRWSEAIERNEANEPFSTACLALTLTLILGFALPGASQSRRQIKVIVESQQSGTHSQEALQGSGSIIIRRGTVHPSGRLTGGDRQTTVQRSTGIFTLVQDGGESILSVATRVPHSQIIYYYNYAAGAGYIGRQIVFTDVGTSLKVSATVLADNQIRVQLVPRISYFSAERPGAIDFTEAATELIVPNGQRVSLGGATTNMHEVTRQILGYRDRTSSSETDLVITATVQ